MADVVASADFDQGLANLSPRDGLLPLMWGERRLASEPNASGLRSFAPFPSPGLYQFPFKLGQPAEDCEHQAPMRGCGVCSSIRE